MAMTPRLGGIQDRQRGGVPSIMNDASAPSRMSKSALKKNRLKQKALTPPPQKALKGGGKGGSSSRADERPPMRLPPGLHGMCPRSSRETNTKRLCFSFNLGTCNAAQPGQDCAKGAHLCMKPTANGEACSQPHWALRCTR